MDAVRLAKGGDLADPVQNGVVFGKRLLGGFAHIILAVRFKFRPTHDGLSKIDSGNPRKLPDSAGNNQPDFGASLLNFAARRAGCRPSFTSRRVWSRAKILPP
jgi:hypothetical protein